MRVKAFVAGSAVVLAMVISVSACGSDAAVSASANPSSSTNVTSGGLEGGQEAATAALYNNEGVKNFDLNVFNLIHGATDEMTNDAERNLTLNNPNRIGYVYVYSASGTLLTFYTIKGKVSSTTSQLTETQDVTEDSGCITGAGDGNGYTTGACDNVVDSIGDDGTYGGEEGGPQGVFFFTTSGALIELGGNTTWFYSDAPLDLTTKPVVVYNNQAPTSGKVNVSQNGNSK